MTVLLALLAGLACGLLAVAQDRSSRREVKVATAVAQVVIIVATFMAGFQDEKWWMVLGGALLGTVAVLALARFAAPRRSARSLGGRGRRPAGGLTADNRDYRRFTGV